MPDQFRWIACFEPSSIMLEPAIDEEISGNSPPEAYLGRSLQASIAAFNRDP
jgi:hypothetical protein